MCNVTGTGGQKKETQTLTGGHTSEVKLRKHLKNGHHRAVTLV